MDSLCAVRKPHYPLAFSLLVGSLSSMVVSVLLVNHCLPLLYLKSHVTIWLSTCIWDWERMWGASGLHHTGFFPLAFHASKDICFLQIASHVNQ
jgi:hypothetical protein